MRYRGRELGVGLVIGLVVLAGLAVLQSPIPPSRTAVAVSTASSPASALPRRASAALAHLAFGPSLTRSSVARTSSLGSLASTASRATFAISTGAPPAAAVASSPVVRTSWAGLGPSDNGYLAGFPTVAPPDVQVAVGPSHVVEMVNLAVSIWTKQGIFLQNKSLAGFFGTPTTEFISDPKVQYDAGSGRWFATITDVATPTNTATGVALLAVSASSDPTGSWRVYKVPSTDTGQCLDQPILGVGASTVIVSVNVFSSCLSNKFTYDGARYWVLSKADLVAGAASPAIQSFGPYASTASFHPAQIVGASSTAYLVSANAFLASTSSIELFRVSGTPPTASVVMSNLSVRTITSPPAATQPGGGGVLPLDTGDFRILDAVWSGGDLWLTLGDACTPAGDSATRSCVRLVEVDTATGTVAQDFEVSSAGRYYLYPALRADAQGDLLVVFAYSSSTDYPGLLAAGRPFGDAPGHLDAPTLIAAGTAPEGLGCTTSAGTCRYGDYFGAAVDPSNASLLWAAGEIGAPTGWGTVIFAGSIKAVLTFSYAIVNGGSGYGLPKVSYTLDGAARSAAMSLAPTNYAADPGTPWSVSVLLMRPNVVVNQTSEVWVVNETAAAPPFSGDANASLIENFSYYHMFLFGFWYRISDNSNRVTPMIQVQAWDTRGWAPAGFQYYVDANSTFSYPNMLTGSTSQEQWITNGPTNGTVTGPDLFSPMYYHQYRVTFDYLLQSTTAVPAPSVAYFHLGANTSIQANATVWADAAQPYAYQTSLTGDGGLVRIGPGAGAVGTVTVPQTIIVTYHLQYLLNVTVNPGTLAGNVTGEGWYDAGSDATLLATAPAGWQFEGWSGAAAGAAPSLTLSMTKPANLTALFYPGLTIAAGNGGSVAYTYGAVSGVVPVGSSRTIYVPMGTQITLTAQPASFVDSFGSWSGAATGSSTTTAVTLSGPMTVTASFGSNVLVVAGIAVAVVLVIVAALLLLLIARRRRKQPPA